MDINKITQLLGDEAESLLAFDTPKIPKSYIHAPGPDWVDKVFSSTDRPPAVLRNLQLLFNNGRLGGTGYLSILPVDQGVEHSGGSAFAPNPIYFDPENIIKLAIEGNCNAGQPYENTESFNKPGASSPVNHQPCKTKC